MNEKECHTCHALLPVTNFKSHRDWQSKKVYVSSQCVECWRTVHRAYNKKWYNTHKKQRGISARRWRQDHLEQAREMVKIATTKLKLKRHTFIVEYLSNHPCEDCGEKDPLVLEFDHLDPTTKLYSISKILATIRPMPILLEEMEKCRILCSNCHQRRTQKQFNTWRFRILNSLQAIVVWFNKKVIVPRHNGYLSLAAFFIQISKSQTVFTVRLDVAV